MTAPYAKLTYSRHWTDIKLPFNFIKTCRKIGALKLLKNSANPIISFSDHLMSNTCTCTYVYMCVYTNFDRYEKEKTCAYYIPDRSVPSQ